MLYSRSFSGTWALIQSMEMRCVSPTSLITKMAASEAMELSAMSMRTSRATKISPLCAERA
eukprot:scaffold133266_cov94-Phaeocystis_antarctica.AAC.3